MFSHGNYLMQHNIIICIPKYDIPMFNVYGKFSCLINLINNYYQYGKWQYCLFSLNN